MCIYTQVYTHIIPHPFLHEIQKWEITYTTYVGKPLAQIVVW